MTAAYKMNFKEYFRESIKKQHNWTADNWTDEDFFQEMIEGAVIYMPIETIVPRTKEEWEDATPHGSLTNGDLFLELNGDTLVLNDGHNRLKTLLKEGFTGKVKCIIKRVR